MKKLRILIVLIGIAVPYGHATAAHFSCVKVTPTIDTVTLQVQSSTVFTEFVKILATTAVNNSYAKSPSGNPVYEGTDKATYTYKDLSPATSYKALVYDGAGTFVEEIKGCVIKTEALPTPHTSETGNQVTPPSPGSSESGNTVKETFVPNKSGQAGGGFLLDVKLQNPLKVDTIKDAVKFFVNTLIKIAIPFIVVFFIWAGLKFILAQGKPDKVTEAKKMFWYTIIGTLLILGAWTITNAIIGTVNSITN